MSLNVFGETTLNPYLWRFKKYFNMDAEWHFFRSRTATVRIMAKANVWKEMQLAWTCNEHEMNKLQIQTTCINGVKVSSKKCVSPSAQWLNMTLKITCGRDVIKRQWLSQTRAFIPLFRWKKESSCVDFFLSGSISKCDLLKWLYFSEKYWCKCYYNKYARR